MVLLLSSLHEDLSIKTHQSQLYLLRFESDRQQLQLLDDVVIQMLLMLTHQLYLANIRIQDANGTIRPRYLLYQPLLTSPAFLLDTQDQLFLQRLQYLPMALQIHLKLQ